MQNRIITSEQTENFYRYLCSEERTENTTQKYLRDISAFREWNGEKPVTKDSVIAYKQHLTDAGYKVRSINSMLASLNSFFSFCGLDDCKVKTLRLQREVYSTENKELSRAEYERLCKAAQKKKNERLNLILQTICGRCICK